MVLVPWVKCECDLFKEVLTWIATTNRLNQCIKCTYVLKLIRFLYPHPREDANINCNGCYFHRVIQSPEQYLLSCRFVCYFRQTLIKMKQVRNLQPVYSPF